MTLLLSLHYIYMCGCAFAYPYESDHMIPLLCFATSSSILQLRLKKNDASLWNGTVLNSPVDHILFHLLHYTWRYQLLL